MMMGWREKILGRWRHMSVDSGARPASITDDELMEMAKGESEFEKLKNLECVTSLVPEKYWQMVGK